jgi:hypothetical protein
MLKLEIQNILNIFINSGKKISTRLTYDFWIKNYPLIYDEMIEYNAINNLKCSNLSEIIYCVLHDITVKPKCNVCGINITNYKNFNLGYVKTCSKKCTNSDPDKIKKALKKYKETCIEKYGVENISQLDSIQKKKEETMLFNYGVKYNSQRTEVKHSISEHITKVNINKNKLMRFNLLSVLKNIDIVNLYNDKNRYLTDLSCLSCNNIFSISQHLAQVRNKSNHIICTICNPILKYTSKGEIELYEFIKQNYAGKIITNSRSIIGPLELDIYLPELNLAFEFNGLYWHSEMEKDKKYHLNKTKLCNEKNIQLIHIYEDDWLYKESIIKSRLKNLLYKSKRIYGRICEIRTVSTIERKLFLNNNHIQGDCISKYNIGLYFNNELISMMTFGKSRFTENLELLRFCNKLNTTIIGGASKLFKYFTNNFKYDNIISYADKSWSNGNLYKQLGFDYLNDTNPNYYWIVNGIKSNRFNWQKHKLVKMGYDKNKTEIQIMHDLGYYRLYDSGSQIWEYKKEIQI